MLAVKEDGQRLIGVGLSPALKHGGHTASSLGEDLDVPPSVVGSGLGDDALVISKLAFFACRQNLVRPLGFPSNSKSIILFFHSSRHLLTFSKT